MIWIIDRKKYVKFTFSFVWQFQSLMNTPITSTNFLDSWIRENFYAIQRLNDIDQKETLQIFCIL